MLLHGYHTVLHDAIKRVFKPPQAPMRRRKLRIANGFVLLSARASLDHYPWSSPALPSQGSSGAAQECVVDGVGGGRWGLTGVW